ncbi:hypothetical protein Poli38472_009930 [Pythium oligandrum]|uniref:Protein kinase domain-containing protein n=1 Tax=Pythium oligandrum TaxID=41045 RepID=A0A8K1C810_PYTOL|nr:hypothetical protein Poli38472_009930 [Pythium oligandrum]|eukprot:TMW58371.1 hypothetical protein Poli38472_009930 [Pythium oligandrum]
MRFLVACSAIALLLSGVFADQAPQTATNANGILESDVVSVCPAQDKRVLRRDATNAYTSDIITHNCTVVGQLNVSESGVLEASSQALDGVLSHPDAPELNFAYNRLVFFSNDVPATTTSSLSLQGNRLTDLDDVTLPPSLQYLNLENCLITSLATAAFPETLQTLRLGSNALYMPAKIKFPKSLRVLAMENQPLQSVDSLELPSKLQTLIIHSTNLSSLNTTKTLPDSIVELNVAHNSLTKFPNMYSFPSIAQVNISFNSIESIKGIHFPKTLKRLDLRGNPLQELEIARSDLAMFQETSYLLPTVSQTVCRSSSAKRVRIENTEICVLEDAEFNRLYEHLASGNRSEATNSSSPSDDTKTTLTPIPTEAAQPSALDDEQTQKPFSWTFLIIGIVTIVMAVMGIISMLSWKHREMRKKMKKMIDRANGLRTSSFNGDLLRAVGLEGELIAPRYESNGIKILRVLGKAGGGIVYLSELRRPQEGEDGEQRTSKIPDNRISSGDLEGMSAGEQLVTLKRMVPEQSGENSRGLVSFIQEIQLMSQLNHPKIISFMGICWNTLADVSMVTEYLPNGDLRTLLKVEKERQAFGHRRRLRWMDSHTSFAPTMSIPANVLPSKSSIALDIVEGLVYLQSFEPAVIHHELRSKNILFSAQYDAKTCNFGAPCEYQLDVTRTTTMDTVAWIAPEVLRGERYTVKSDIYSFGIILTELATCSVPFEGMANAAIVLKVTNDDERPSLDDAECPDQIKRLARLCMSGKPEERPSAVQLHRDLRGFHQV